MERAMRIMIPGKQVINTCSSPTLNANHLMSFETERSKIQDADLTPCVTSHEQGLTNNTARVQRSCYSC